MAVYPNGRHAVRNPGRYFGVAPGLDVYARSRGDRLNIYTSPNTDKVSGGTPTGYGLTGITPPLKSGGLASNPKPNVVISTIANALMGVPTSGTASFGVDTSPANRLPLDDTPQSVTGVSSFLVDTTPANRLPLDDTPQSVTGTLTIQVLGTSTSRYPLDDTPQSVTASAEILFYISPVTGEIVASAGGIANISVDWNNPLLIASISGFGTANLQVFSIPPTLGAEASMMGEASFTLVVAPAQRNPVGSAPPILSANSGIAVTATSTSRLPASDLSPIRTALALFGVGGTLTPHAVGILRGSTEDTTGITPNAVAQAVWTALATDLNIAGTMGKKLIDVSGGVSGGGLTEEQNAAILGAHTEARMARQLAGNKALITSLEDESKVITIYGDDGVTVVRELSISKDGSIRELI